MQRILVIVGLGLVLIGFQNCQQAKTSATNSSLTKAQGDLVPVTANDPEDVNGQIEQPATPEVPPAAPAPGKKDYSGDYVCILDGPGKSVKLGANDAGVPAGQNSIPQVLCMSKNACLNIASQVFGVKGPEFRGYCKLPHGSPQVSHITDAQLQTKVNALKP